MENNQQTNNNKNTTYLETIRTINQKKGFCCNCVRTVWLTEDAVAVLDAADQVHAVDLAGLGALLDDHRQPAVHAVLARQQVPELLGSALIINLKLVLQGDKLFHQGTLCL